jgi:hypothetical protein
MYTSTKEYNFVTEHKLSHFDIELLRDVRNAMSEFTALKVLRYMYPAIGLKQGLLIIRDL